MVLLFVMFVLFLLFVSLLLLLCWPSCQTKSAASPHGLNPSEEVQEGVRALEDGNPYVGMRRKRKRRT